MNELNKKHASVEKIILFSIALQNLKHKKLRSILTLFGIAIGIGSIYFLLSFGLGLQLLVTNEVVGSQSIKTIDVVSPNSSIIKLDDITSRRIGDISEVEQTGSAYYFPGSLKLNNSESDVIVYGVDAGYQDLTNLNLISGELPNNDGTDEGAKAVLNIASLESIGLSEKPEEMLNKQVTVIVPLQINGEAKQLEANFTIGGIIDSGSGAELFIPAKVFREYGVPMLSQMKVGVRTVEDVATVRTQIESFGFETTSPVDTLNEINAIFRYLNFVLIGFGSIGMIIAVLGMFNTMTISLLERTKEIGLMFALGARSIDMRFLFMFEAMLLSSVGSFVGIASAIILSQGLTVVMNIFARGRGVTESFALFSHPWWLMLSSMAFMLVVGFAVVYVPAKRAEKIRPIDALRRE
ncbi:MAG TPA: ABC transporter permease [Candidatus Saccharibacteria bacterium]|nr:ABC transporter permease [Candidatus Saccharibacteria bacterium]